MAAMTTTGTVVAVSVSATHSFSKPNALAIRIVEGVGVEGDAHAGATVRHRSRVSRAPAAPNLRQVHLLAQERLDDLQAEGFPVHPGAMGENVTTAGVDLLALPTGTRLRLGADAVVEVTGLRNPCRQLDAFAPGLMNANLGRDASGELVRKAGVMAIAIASGVVRPGDAIEVVLPDPPHVALAPV